MNKNRKRKNDIMVVTYIFVVLFLFLMGYMVYHIQFISVEEVNNSYNTRQENLARRIIRGNITDKDKNILAGTRVGSNGIETRVYPYGESFAHVVGYSTKGRTGIELLANISLLTSNADIGEKISNELSLEKSMGDTIVSTLDTTLQLKADEALGANKGAVIALDPYSGKILAMVSHPSFNPNDVVENWDALNQMTVEAPLLNRACSGLYPPGSTFKIVTLLEYLRENDDSDDYKYECKGSFSIDGTKINCYHNSVHGAVDLERSFAKSCNSSFANIGSKLDNKRFIATSKELLFGEKLPLKLSTQESVFGLNAASTMENKLQSAIGQGQTLVTPMHMCLITSAIANEGCLMKPMLIDRIENYAGVVFKQYNPAKYKQLIDEEEAIELKEYMSAVTDYGTAKELNSSKYKAFGKTGSAEYMEGSSQSHAWFTGFAEYEGKSIVVTVIAEGAGSGSAVAVPIAKEVFDKYYE